MALMKYVIYIGIILIIAFFFEQIMTVLYDSTLQGIAGNVNAYLLLVVIWVIIYFVARIVFDKKVHPKSSHYALLAGILHVSIMLALFFANSNPLLLLIFPVIIGVIFWTRKKHPTAPKFAFKFQPTHPLYIDDRSGMAVFRIGKDGFLLLKFFMVKPPLPVKELLLYLYRQGIEFTFEIHHQGDTRYYIGLLARGRHLDTLHNGCLEQVNMVRQFCKKLGVTATEVGDCLNVLQILYAPYFLYTPPRLSDKGVPLQFPHLSAQGTEVLIEHELEEFAFTVHKLTPAYTKNNEFYPFLETVEDSYYLQFHMVPLTAEQIDAKEEQANQQYRSTLKRMTGDLENNSEFQAAAYLFNQMEPSKENIEPLMKREELKRLKQVKESLKKLEDGRTIGLWTAGCYLLSSSAVAQALAIKLDAQIQPLSPYSLPRIGCRQGIDAMSMIGSKELSNLFPNQLKQMEPPPEITAEESL
ncbi:MAG: hypothetical protein LUQ65_10595 [Candidatus Helarchaeota archaeon]|nr:hypothetical protein [Candidatus Helarchaeota archaeon]